MNARQFPLRPIVAVSVAVLRNGRVLIARRARSPLLGIYAFPGGGVEVGETLIQAAERELAEETGLKTEVLGFLGHVEPIVREGDRIREHYVINVFLARWAGGEPVPSPELDDFAWVSADEIRAYPTTPELPDLAARALGMKPQTP